MLPSPSPQHQIWRIVTNVIELTPILHLPIPRIYTSSSDSQNPVGAAYIIEEKAQGRPLGSLWHQWDIREQLNLVVQIVEIQKRMSSVSFKRHGCIYFKDDLEQRGLPTQPVEAQVLRSDTLTESLSPEVMMKFTLGPLAEARLWEGERLSMDLDRGPC